MCILTKLILSSRERIRVEENCRGKPTSRQQLEHVRFWVSLTEANAFYLGLIIIGEAKAGLVIAMATDLHPGPLEGIINGIKKEQSEIIVTVI